MGIFSRFEGRMEDGIEGAANMVFDAPISPVQIAKKAERAMRREKMVGAGRQYAPTLYTVLVNPDDDRRLFGYYPTLAGETETYLSAKAAEAGLAMDGQPLVRFIVDEELRHGKFDIIAEMVSAPIIAQLRQEEMARYGLAPQPARPQQAYAPEPGYATAGASRSIRQPQQAYRPYDGQQQAYAAQPAPQAAQPAAAGGFAPLPDYGDDAPAEREMLPYVPEDEIDRSIDYGEYTFNSQDFESYEQHGMSAAFTPNGAGRETYGRRESLPLDPAYRQGTPISNNLGGLDVGAYDPDASGAVRASRPASRPAQAQASLGRHASTPVQQAPQSRPRASQPNRVSASLTPARLVNTSTNRAYVLARTEMTFGRSSANDIVIDDINASRNHARFRYEPAGYWTITDLGSTNGTYVNGERITSVPLSEGDRISAGMTDLVFTLR